MVAVALSNSLLSIVNNLSLVPQCLSASCGALALAANSHSLAAGCCLSGVACWLQPTTAHWCASMSLCLMWCSCSCSQQPLIGCRLLLLPLWCCSHRQSACSQQPFIGCRLLLLPLWCCASLACSHRLAFSSISIINNRSLVRLNVSLPHVVLLLLQPTAAHWL